ncbi:MAG: endonuclease III domain-containing protein [Candidatus Ornithospirochaeta sp.]
MKPNEMENEYLDSVFSCLAATLEDMGAPIPAVSVIAGEDNSPYRILTSTIISLRTRDKVTMEASMRLFKIAPDFETLYKTDEKDVADAIKPCGFYTRKASQMKAIAKLVVEEWNGRLPSDMETLLSLPGVGIKTASLVLNLAYGADAVCVDCHVHQICNRLGWVDTQKPEETEAELRKILPRKYWIPLNELLVMWGQNVCTPISPKCFLCPLSQSCPTGKEGKSR